MTLFKILSEVILCKLQRAAYPFGFGAEINSPLWKIRWHGKSAFSLLLRRIRFLPAFPHWQRKRQKAFLLLLQKSHLLPGRNWYLPKSRKPRLYFYCLQQFNPYRTAGRLAYLRRILFPVSGIIFYPVSEKNSGSSTRAIQEFQAFVRKPLTVFLTTIALPI